MLAAVFMTLTLVAPHAGGSLREELKALQPLVGSCWTGTFPGGKSTDTHCFEAMFDGKLVRDRHVVRGASKPYAGETTYAWDPKERKVVYTYWASDGGISTGTMEPGEGQIVFPESYSGETGSAEMRNVWKITGPDSYEISVLRKMDGEWRESLRMTMRRTAR